MKNNLNMDEKKIYDLGYPVSDEDAVDKRFFEQEIQK